MDVFVNVDERPFATEVADGTAFSSFGSMAIGEGSQVFRADQSGIWLGAETFAAAPFKVNMAGNATMTSATVSGYVEDVGGDYTSTATAAAAKIQLLPDANTGIVAYASNGTTKVFEVVVGSTNVGDVSLGDYAGGNGVLWDQSAGDLIIKGDMKAGTIDGVAITGGTITGSTFKTASTGTRVEISSTDDDIKLYDSGNDEVFRIDDEAGYITIKAKDSRHMTIDTVTAGYDIYLDSPTHIQGDLDMRNNDIDDVASIDGGGNDVNFADSIGMGGNNINHCNAINTDYIDVHDNSQVQVNDDLYVNGALSKNSGTFDIPHPDPAKTLEYRLRHSFVESPTAGDLIYRFEADVVGGLAEIDLPDYFQYLNDNPQVWVSPVDVLGIAKAQADLQKVYVQANTDGKYNVLVIGTRKDDLGVDAWAKYGLEYKAKDRFKDSDIAMMTEELQKVKDKVK